MDTTAQPGTADVNAGAQILSLARARQHSDNSEEGRGARVRFVLAGMRTCLCGEGQEETGQEEKGQEEKGQEEKGQEEKGQEEKGQEEKGQNTPPHVEQPPFDGSGREG
ncbi:hypothetical protein E4U21_004702 [Claviceps maximensis]|nr:hypothetical protein E4U21_004702 [Claviceps maximensis]